MGLFSSKKKHFVDTATLRVVENALVPDILATTIAEVIFKDQPYGPTVVNNILNAQYRNFERAYRYAESGDYFYGLPNLTTSSSAVDGELFQEYISQELGIPKADVSVEYGYFRPLNNFHYARKVLLEQYGYDENTNTVTSGVTAPLETLVYVEKIVAFHDAAPGLEPDANALGSWEEETTQELSVPGGVYIDRISAANDWDPSEEIVLREDLPEGVELHFVYEDPETDDLVRTVIFESMTQFDEDQEYFQAKYRYAAGNATQLGYWIYDPLTGIYPELNNLFQSPTFINPGSYFPFIVFRSEDENRATPAVQDTEEYKTTSKLCDLLGFDFQEVADSVHENPDIDDVRQAVMMMAVPITSGDPIDIEYMMEYFKDVEGKLPDQLPKSELFSFTGLTNGAPTSYMLEISDADFSLRLSFDNLAVRYVAGSIGNVGDYTNTVGTVTVEEAFGPRVSIQTPTNLNVSGLTTRFLRHQITAGVYQEVEIKNPGFRYKIFKNKSAEGQFDDERMLIPIDYNVARTIPILRREKLYYRSLHFVANSHIVQKVKWYESGLFKALIVVIAVVISLYDSGLTLKAVLSGLAAGGTAALAVSIIIISTIVQVLVVGKLIEIGLETVAEAVGADFATLLAIAALVYGAYGGFTNAELLFQVKPTQLISLASNLYQQAIKLELSDIVTEYEEFEEYKEDQLELLDEANELLGDANLDPWVFIDNTPLFVRDETPSQFYARTVENPNPGIQSLNFIQNFFDTSLKLPSID